MATDSEIAAAAAAMASCKAWPVGFAPGHAQLLARVALSAAEKERPGGGPQVTCSDLGAIAVALSLLAHQVKARRRWTRECDHAQAAAFDALNKIGSALFPPAELNDRAFESWLAGLAAARTYCGYDGLDYIKQTGAECWRDMFDDGLSPDDAASEEMLAAAESAG